MPFLLWLCCCLLLLSYHVQLCRGLHPRACLLSRRVGSPGWTLPGDRFRSPSAFSANSAVHLNLAPGPITDATAAAASGVAAGTSWILRDVLVPLRGGASPHLGGRELVIAALPVLLSAGLARALSLRSLSRSIVVSSFRLSFQLLLFGGALLQYLFRPGTSPLPVLIWMGLAGFVAAREASARVPHTYRGMAGDCAAASGVGVWSALLYTRTFVLRDATALFWSGRVVVPLAGILYGNAAARTGTCLTVVLAEVAEGRDRIEARLARGAGVWEAARQVVRDGVGAAMAPTLTQMAATGLVTMPGMMTGSILSGQDPAQAAAYQIAIFFSICASSCASSLIVAWLVLRRTFDAATARLLPEEESTLRRRTDEVAAPAVPSANASSDANASAPRTFSLVQNLERQPEQDVVLRVDGLAVQRTGLTVSFDLARGERLGVVGKSGIGKSQLLRTIAGIEAARGGSSSDGDNGDCDGSASLRSSGDDIHLKDTDAVCLWRSRVAWVSQDRSTLPGTPSDFYREVCSFRAIRQRDSTEGGPPASEADLERHCQAWSLPARVMDRPWKSLSGGEAQRAMLAVVLSTRPEVLLLDEPTSACDAETTAAIETTLAESGIPVVMVSHSEDQVRRFCTGVLSLA